MQGLSPNQIAQTFNEQGLMYAAIKAGHGLSLIHTRRADGQDPFIRCFDNIEELFQIIMMLIAPAAYRRRVVTTFRKIFAPHFAKAFV